MTRQWKNSRVVFRTLAPADAVALDVQEQLAPRLRSLPVYSR